MVAHFCPEQAGEDEPSRQPEKLAIIARRTPIFNAVSDFDSVDFIPILQCGR